MLIHTLVFLVDRVGKGAYPELHVFACVFLKIFIVESGQPYYLPFAVNFIVLTYKPHLIRGLPYLHFPSPLSLSLPLFPAGNNRDNFLAKLSWGDLGLRTACCMCSLNFFSCLFSPYVLPETMKWYCKALSWRLKKVFEDFLGISSLIREILTCDPRASAPPAC